MRALAVAHDPGGASAVGACAAALRDAGWHVDLWARGPARARFEQMGIEHRIASDRPPEPEGAQVLVAGTSIRDRLEWEALGRARQAGVPSVSVLDYWFNYRARFERGRLQLPDLLTAIDEECLEGMAAEGLPRECIRVVGHPYLAWLADRIEPRPPRAGPARTVLFASQPDQNEVENLERAIGALRAHSPLEHLRVRFHPRQRDPSSSLAALERSGLPWSVDESADPLASVRDHDVVLGITSMLLVEAALAGIPAGSIAHGTADPLVTHRLGLTVSLSNRDEILRFLEEPPDARAREEFVANHAGAAERVVALCTGLAHG